MEGRNNKYPCLFQMYTRPPDMSEEVWQNWIVFWGAWKEVYISLSWVHKYRDHCTAEYVQWYDSYIEESPLILPEIMEGLRDSVTNLEPGNNCSKGQENADDSTAGNTTTELDIDPLETKRDTDSETQKESERKQLDALYDKHSEKLYWLHLKKFLLRSGVELTDKLQGFFRTFANMNICVDKNVDVTEGGCETDIVKDDKESKDDEESKDNANVDSDKLSNASCQEMFPICDDSKYIVPRTDLCGDSLKNGEDSFEKFQHVDKNLKREVNSDGDPFEEFQPVDKKYKREVNIDEEHESENAEHSLEKVMEKDDSGNNLDLQEMASCVKNIKKKNKKNKKKPRSRFVPGQLIFLI